MTSFSGLRAWRYLIPELMLEAPSHNCKTLYLNAAFPKSPRAQEWEITRRKENCSLSDNEVNKSEALLYQSLQPVKES